MRFTVVLLCALLAGCAQQPVETAPTPPTGAMGPDWSFTDTRGAVHTRESNANATVIFFMASWCGSCRSKAPVLADAQDAHEREGVRFLSVSWDNKDAADRLDAWAREFRNDWPHGVDPGFAIQRAFGVTSQSSVVALDADGNLVRKWGYGAVTGESLDEALAEALKRSAAAAAA